MTEQATLYFTDDNGERHEITPVAGVRELCERHGFSAHSSGELARFIMTGIALRVVDQDTGLDGFKELRAGEHHSSSFVVTDSRGSVARLTVLEEPEFFEGERYLRPTTTPTKSIPAYGEDGTPPDEEGRQSLDDIKGLIRQARFDTQPAGEVARHAMLGLIEYIADPANLLQDVRDAHTDDYGGCYFRITDSEEGSALVVLTALEPDEPKKSGYWTRRGYKSPGTEMQSMEDLMELQESVEDHDEGRTLGWVITAMIDLVGDSGTTFKDVRDVRTGQGYAAFLLTDHEHTPARITLTFED